jgi:hypothetical protein
MNGIRGNIPFSSSRPAAQEPTGPYVRIPWSLALILLGIISNGTYTLVGGQPNVQILTWKTGTINNPNEP